jgi:hypothetical protein
MYDFFPLHILSSSGNKGGVSTHIPFLLIKNKFKKKNKSKFISSGKKIIKKKKKNKTPWGFN